MGAGLTTVITSLCIEMSNHCCTLETNIISYVSHASIKKIHSKFLKKNKSAVMNILMHVFLVNICIFLCELLGYAVRKCSALVEAAISFPKWLH